MADLDLEEGERPANILPVRLPGTRGNYAKFALSGKAWYARAGKTSLNQVRAIKRAWYWTHVCALVSDAVVVELARLRQPHRVEDDEPVLHGQRVAHLHDRALQVVHQPATQLDRLDVLGEELKVDVCNCEYWMGQYILLRKIF